MKTKNLIIILGVIGLSGVSFAEAPNTTSTVEPADPAAKTAPASQMDLSNPNRPTLGGEKAKSDTKNHPLVKKHRTNPDANKDTTEGQLGGDKGSKESSPTK